MANRQGQVPFEQLSADQKLNWIASSLQKVRANQIELAKQLRRIEAYEVAIANAVQAKDIAVDVVNMGQF